MKLVYLGMGENISAKHHCNEKHIMIITMEGGGNGGNWHLRLVSLVHQAQQRNSFSHSPRLKEVELVYLCIPPLSDCTNS